MPTAQLSGDLQMHPNIPDRAENMAARIPKNKLMVIPGASGFVQHSVPEQCVALWREFVAQLGHPGQRHED